jgi:hypothetical protein
LIKRHAGSGYRYTRSKTQYLSKDEQWARSYAQWIAIRSKDTVLLDQVKKITLSTNPAASASQWVEADFEPIAAAMDLIFKTLGWLK